ncbi:hypothetical protein [Solemya elarraichensis gill symbiont]|nr:hypothetical protein [Solemya elarraichensis gill symbiont]
MRNLFVALLLVVVGIVMGYTFAMYQKGEMANIYTDKLPGCW